MAKETDTLFSVLDKFLKPIVSKEKWYKDRDVETIQDLFPQIKATSKPLLSNEFLLSLKQDHSKHEKIKRRKIGEEEKKLSMRLRPEINSLQVLEETDLSRQGSIPFNFDKAEEDDEESWGDISDDSGSLLEALPAGMNLQSFDHEKDDDLWSKSFTQAAASKDTLAEAIEGFNKRAKIANEKSSLNTKSSSWILKRFCPLVTEDHFDFTDFDSEKLEDCDSIASGESKTLISQLKQALRIYCGSMGEIPELDDPSCFAYLHHKETKESLVKLFMNHIIGLLCTKKHLKVHQELMLGRPKSRKRGMTDVPDEEFPIRPRSDYILAYEGKMISSFELKAPNTINKNAVVPLMLQLLKIQQFQQDPGAKYLGVLTDGYKYVLIFLQGNKFTFQREPEGQKVKIHKAKTWADVTTVMNVLCGAVDFCLGNKTQQSLLFCAEASEMEMEQDTIVIDESDESDGDIFEL